MGDGYVSEYIIWRKQKSHLEIHNKVRMHFCRDHYCIEEWHTSTPYDIFWNQYNYQNMCLLLDTWYRTDHCITFCGKWIFDSHFELAFPLTQGFLNYICFGNDTDEMRLDLLLSCMQLEQSLIKFSKKIKY